MNKRIGFLLSLDLVMFLVALLLECLSLTGLKLHEWIGFALCPLVLLHVVLQWDWFRAQFRKIAIGGAGGRARINSALNIFLLILMASTLISGVLISHQVVPLVEERLGQIHVWMWVHDVVNKFLFVILGLHLALNWNWLTAALRRLRPTPPAQQRTSAVSASPLLLPQNSRLQRILVRSFVVFLGFWVSGFVGYVAFIPVAGEQDGQTYAQSSPGLAFFDTPSLQKIPPRNGRPRDLRAGISELRLVLVILAFSAVFGRYVLRLRL